MLVSWTAERLRVSPGVFPLVHGLPCGVYWVLSHYGYLGVPSCSNLVAPPVFACFLLGFFSVKFVISV